MASYNELIALIDAFIKRNGVQAITGQILNGVLKAMVDQVGRGYAIMGVATPSTNPGTPDAPESWFASTPGTYTNFGGLEVADAEFALLSYTPSGEVWTKTTLTEGIQEVSASIDGNVGTPEVTAEYINGGLIFTFSNMKGQTGDAAGFGTVNATVDGNIGTPGVSVNTSGPDTAKNITFAFRNLKGETGVTSVVATVDNTSGTPSCAVSLVGQELHLDFHGLKGAQGDTGSSVDYPFTIVNNLTTDDPTQALSAAQGVVLDGKVSQLEAEVVSFCGSETLIQYSTSRLISRIYPKSNYQYFARLWLSDDVNYECIVIAGNTPNPNASGVVFQTSWGADKETTQTAILSCTLDYCWMFVRDKNNTSGEVLPEQVWLNGWFFADYINTNEETIAEIRSQVAGTIVLPISQGHWTKYPTTAGVPGLLERRTTNAKRMASTDKFYNNGNSVSCSCKNGYQCNIYYVNEATGAEYLTGWAQENSAQKTNAEFNVFAIVIKRTDDADVTASDLDCIESFIYHSDLSDLEVRVESLEQTVNEKYADRPANGYEEFTVSVDTSVPDTDGTALSLQDTQTFENDKGKIYLPTSYSATGNPTRLIIHCHGASQNYNNGTVFPKASSLVTIDYLLAKGYAVMDVNGLPGTHSFYATTCGNPVAYRSYLAAYKWAVTKYNLYKDIFVIGISAGSVPALQISQIETVPVLACVTYCGLMDFSRGWMLLGGYHPNSQGPNIKGYLADKFAFTGTRPTLGNIDPCSDAEWEYVVSNWAKFSGWNPYTMGISSTITREEYRTILSVVYGSEVPDWINADYSFESVQKMLLSFKIPQRGDLSTYQTALAQEQKLFDTCSVHRKVPLKMFHATDDDVAPYRYSKYFYEMCKRGGSTVEFRTFASGGHNPTGNTQNVTVGGVSITTNTLSLEVLDWLQRFE